MVAGTPTREDGRVVGERDRGKRRDRSPLVGRAEIHQAAHVGRFARGGHVVEDVGVHAVEEESQHLSGPVAVERVAARRLPVGGYPSVGAGASQPSSAAIVGATSTRRAARGTTPSARTPRPATTNGARACPMPSEPCSPRWPPWSSQLWSAEWTTQRSGAAGWSNSCATCSNVYGYELLAARRIRVGALGGETGERGGGLVGERVDPRDLDDVEGAALTAEPNASVHRGGLVFVGAGRLQHHVDDRRQLVAEQ